MEKITWTDRARNDQVLQEVMEDRDILYTKKKANRTGHILRRDGLLKHDTKGETEGRSDGKTSRKTYAATG
jgi:hypothetical protein